MFVVNFNKLLGKYILFSLSYDFIVLSLFLISWRVIRHECQNIVGVKIFSVYELSLDTDIRFKY